MLATSCSTPVPVFTASKDEKARLVIAQPYRCLRSWCML